MQKVLASTGALLVIGAFFIALAAGASHGASPTDEFTIPLDTDVNLSENMTVHLIQLTISNLTYGGAYSPDPENAVWPILTFQYENNGMSQVRGRLHVILVDNTSTVPAGYKYDKIDVTIMQPITPGERTGDVTMEFAMPKGRLVSKIVIVDDGVVSQKAAEIPIVYPTPAPSPTPAPLPDIVGDDNLRNLLIIPILLGIVGLVGWFMARNRLF